MRRIGLVSLTRSTVPGAQCLVTSVWNGPGITVFTRTFGLYAPAKPSVSALRPAFAIAYGRSNVFGRCDPAVLTLMIEPPSPSNMRLPNNEPRRNGPRAFSAWVLS